MRRLRKHTNSARGRDQTDGAKLNEIIAEARRNQEKRETTYRERALRLFPSICGRCGKEFSGKTLKELTVHHKDHNHDNNPPDGSNWELLCEYCHEREHARYREEHGGEDPENRTELETPPINSPFVGLETLLKKKI